MITLIEALNFRCLRYTNQSLGEFQVLVGPNASGKTTFLDVVSFLGDLVNHGPERAVRKRTEDIHDLFWMCGGTSFELAIEARIPKEKRRLIRKKEYDTVRYEVKIGIDEDSDEIGIQGEQVLLKKSSVEESPHSYSLFPEDVQAPKTILTSAHNQQTVTILNKKLGGNDNFYSETYREGGKGWTPSFRLGPRKSTLANLPEDETDFPVSIWLKSLLIAGVQNIVLNSQTIRQMSPPGQRRYFKPDGSNLPWVIAKLQEESPAKFDSWIEHLQTALSDLKTIQIEEREDIRHKYLVVEYANGLRVPAWMVSDGTLRLLALTLPAYLSDFDGVYLIEEPENGIHPRAVEAMYKSLSSVYSGQIIMATHSPIILSIVKPSEVLCFAKTLEGATDIVRGSAHPNLRSWQGEQDLGTMFAAGVLG